MSDREKKAIYIVQKLRESGFVSYLCGGCVRDRIMGRPPKDYDIVTNARPNHVQKIFQRTVLVGAQFGVVQVILDKSSFDVASFRQDGDYLDHRHPSEISYCDEKGDALRRDFTVNGLFYDPDNDKIIDYVGGLSDIQNRVIRTIGSPEERFNEDRLRMMRAIRFACQLNFNIEQSTWDAITLMAEGITQISNERIRDELSLMLTGPSPAEAISLLYESRLLSFILPEVVALRDTEQPSEYHPEGNVWIHTLSMLKEMKKSSVEFAMGVLLHDIGKPLTMTNEDRIRFNGHEKAGADIACDICDRLRFSNASKEKIVALVSNHMRFLSVRKMKISTLKRLLRMEHFDDLLELHRLDCIASNGDLDSYDFCISKLQEFTQDKLSPAPLIMGKDLIELGLNPGPVFGEILKWIEELQLEGKLTTRDDALNLIRKNY